MTPTFVVDSRVERTAGAPTVLFEVGLFLQVGDRPDTKPRDGLNRFRDAEQMLEERLAVERHPTDSVAFGGRREPEVLDGETDGVEASRGDGVATEHCRSPARR